MRKRCEKTNKEKLPISAENTLQIRTSIYGIEMKKLIITGASGLLGSKIVEQARTEFKVFPTHASHPLQSDSLKLNITSSSQVRSVFSEVNPDFFVQRPKALDEMLPWDFIDHGIHKAHLIKEYKLALKGQESDMCRVGECRRCGIC